MSVIQLARTTFIICPLTAGRVFTTRNYTLMLLENFDQQLVHLG